MTPVIRSAASRPETSAVGTPTPGTVEEPASTTFSMPRMVLAGRNGPVWPNVCASANGVPAAMPCLAHPVGSRGRLEDLLCVSRTDGIPIDFSDSGIGCRSQYVEQVAASGRKPGVTGGRPGDQQRRVTHHAPVVDDVTEGLLPCIAEDNRVMPDVGAGSPAADMRDESRGRGP
jgi:hypothetical protein